MVTRKVALVTHVHFDWFLYFPVNFDLLSSFVRAWVPDFSAVHPEFSDSNPDDHSTIQEKSATVTLKRWL